MYYQIHILKREEDGIYRHLPLYFMTTPDFKTAKQNFHNVVENFFWGEEKPVITSPDRLGTCMIARGEITAHYNLRGTYAVELVKTFRDMCFKPII